MTDLDSADINKLITVNGTVIRTSSRKVLQKKKQFKCSMCGYLYTINAEHENYGVFVTTTLKCTQLVMAEKKSNPLFDMVLGMKKGFQPKGNNYN